MNADGGWTAGAIRQAGRRLQNSYLRPSALLTLEFPAARADFHRGADKRLIRLIFLSWHYVHLFYQVAADGRTRSSSILPPCPRRAPIRGKARKSLSQVKADARRTRRWLGCGSGFARDVGSSPVHLRESCLIRLHLRQNPFLLCREVVRRHQCNPRRRDPFCCSVAAE